MSCVGGQAGVVAGVVCPGAGQEEGAGEGVEWPDGQACCGRCGRSGLVLGKGHPVLEPGDSEGRIAPSHRAHHLYPLALTRFPEAKGNDGWGNYTPARVEEDPAPRPRRQVAPRPQPRRASKGCGWGGRRDEGREEEKREINYERSRKINSMP